MHVVSMGESQSQDAVGLWGREMVKGDGQRTGSYRVSVHCGQLEFTPAGGLGKRV